MKPACLLIACVALAYSQPSGLNVACSLDEAVTEPDGKVQASALADNPNHQQLKYSWSAAAGVFDPIGGNSDRVQWHVMGAKPGPHLLTARVTGPNGVAGACSVTVLVVRPGTRSKGPSFSPTAVATLGSEARRALLPKAASERPGYGLYSYILLGARPADDTARNRVDAVLNAYLELEDAGLETWFKLPMLNVTYVPVSRDAPDAGAPTLNWVVSNYDYARARFLLAKLPKQSGDGPFIVSLLKPLSAATGDPGPFLLQNFSTIPVSVIPFWMRQFRTETTQQRVWERRSIESVALDLRTAIAVAAEGLPAVINSVKALVVVNSGQ